MQLIIEIVIIVIGGTDETLKIYAFIHSIINYIIVLIKVIIGGFTAVYIRNLKESDSI